MRSSKRDKAAHPLAGESAHVKLTATLTDEEMLTAVLPSTKSVFAFEHNALPEAMKPWDVVMPEYEPTDFTDPRMQDLIPWADDAAKLGQYKFNTIDDSVDPPVDRTSFTGTFELCKAGPFAGRPQNPKGRTNLAGRGVLARFGPNHAGAAMVTRFRKKGKNLLRDAAGHPICEFVLEWHEATEEWTLPSGMLGPGQSLYGDLKDMFLSDGDGVAVKANKRNKQERAEIERKVTHLFANGVELSKDGVNDPRNTDHAWVENVVMHYHDETGDTVRHCKFLNEISELADKQLKWVEITPSTSLYPSHESHIITARENLISNLEDLKGKKRKLFFKKWHKMRTSMQETISISKYKKSHPNSIALKHFDEKAYRKMNEPTQRAFMRCLYANLKLPQLDLGLYMQSCGSYREYTGYLTNVLEEFAGVPPISPQTRKESQEHSDKKKEAVNLDLSRLGLPFLSIRARLHRNFVDIPMSPAMSQDDRCEVENRLVKAFDYMNHQLKNSHYKGKYHSLTPGHPNFMDEKKFATLVANNTMFPKPSRNQDQGFPGLEASGAANKWPYGRGCFISSDGKFNIWVGQSDHLKVIVQQKSRGIYEVWSKCKHVMDTVTMALEAIRSEAAGQPSRAHTPDPSGADKEVVAVEAPKKKPADVPPVWGIDPKFGACTLWPGYCGSGLQLSLVLPVPQLVNSKSHAELVAICARFRLRLDSRIRMQKDTLQGCVVVEPMSHYTHDDRTILHRSYDSIKELKRFERTDAGKQDRSKSAGRGGKASKRKPKPKPKAQSKTPAKASTESAPTAKGPPAPAAPAASLAPKPAASASTGSPKRSGPSAKKRSGKRLGKAAAQKPAKRGAKKSSKSGLGARANGKAEAAAGEPFNKTKPLPAIGKAGAEAAPADLSSGVAASIITDLIAAAVELALEREAAGRKGKASKKKMEGAAATVDASQASQEQHMAATKIQQGFRGYKKRKKKVKPPSSLPRNVAKA